MTIRAAMGRRLARVIDWLPGATSFILLAVRMPSRVRNDSQFLLDGYPRSANTLACFRIQTMSPGRQFAHHTHKSSQLKKAVRLFPFSFALRLESPLSHLLRLPRMRSGRIWRRSAVRTMSIAWRTPLPEIRAMLMKHISVRTSNRTRSFFLRQAKSMKECLARWSSRKKTEGTHLASKMKTGPMP